MWFREAWERAWAVTCVTVIMVAFVVVNPMMPLRMLRAGNPVASPALESNYWPTAANTGVPDGTALTAYTGSCLITTNNVTINAKIVDCTGDPDAPFGLDVRAANLTITNSYIIAAVSIDEANTGYSFTISDSTIAQGDTDSTGLGGRDFTATRVEISDGRRGVYCAQDCTVTDSWIHTGHPDETGTEHMSGMRMGFNTTYVHNRIRCSAPILPPDAGCSADLTGYGDFSVIHDNMIRDNLFETTEGSVCAYGGSTLSKPFPHGHHISFIDNVFMRHNPDGSPHYADNGIDLDCGIYGYATDFEAAQPGNVWTNNRFDSRTGPIAPPVEP